jgi:hypothetical protein
LQIEESEWNWNKTFGLDAQEVEVTGLEQNASYVFEAFIIETDGSKTSKEKISSDYFHTLECNANGYHIFSHLKLQIEAYFFLQMTKQYFLNTIN